MLNWLLVFSNLQHLLFKCVKFQTESELMTMCHFNKLKKRKWTMSVVVICLVLIAVNTFLFLLTDVIQQSIASYLLQQIEKSGPLQGGSINYYTTVDNKNKSSQLSLSILGHEIDFKILIGIGCQKCGSSYVRDCMSAVYHTLYNDIKSPSYKNKDKFSNYFVFSPRKERHYWDYCKVPRILQPSETKITTYDQYNIKCTVKDYLSKAYIEEIESQKQEMDLIKNINNSSTINGLFFEKTPRYFRHYSSCYFLTQYTTLYPNKFYMFVLLRNPVKRVYSKYWMYYKNNKDYDKFSDKDVNRLYNTIKNDLKHFKNEYPDWYAIYKLVSNLDNSNDNNGNNNNNTYGSSSSSTSKTSTSSSLIEEQIGIKYKYSKHKLYNYLIESFIFDCCYYPQILLWINTFEMFNININNDRKLSDSLKIIQTEYFFSHMNITIFELTKWAFKNDIKMMDNGINQEKILSVINQLDKKNYGIDHLLAHAASDKIDIMDTKVGAKLKKFYDPCNQQLYNFLKKNENFLVGSFPPWWDVKDSYWK